MKRSVSLPCPCGPHVLTCRPLQCTQLPSAVVAAALSQLSADWPDLAAPLAGFAAAKGVGSPKGGHARSPSPGRASARSSPSVRSGASRSPSHSPLRPRSGSRSRVGDRDMGRSTNDLAPLDIPKPPLLSTSSVSSEHKSPSSASHPGGSRFPHCWCCCCYCCCCSRPRWCPAVVVLLVSRLRLLWLSLFRHFCDGGDVGFCGIHGNHQGRQGDRLLRPSLLQHCDLQRQHRWRPHPPSCWTGRPCRHGCTRS